MDPNSALLEWYGKLHSRRVDLVGDYAGQELFVLEGDSLLLRSFSDPKLDFGYGLQMLHAGYIVESFLQALVQRRCNFHLVFFDAHSDLCIPKNTPQENRPKYRLARTAIIKHLEAHLPQSNHSSIHIRNFPSSRDSDFQQYLDEFAVYFIMCHDGATPGSRTDRDQQLLFVTKSGKICRKFRFRKMIHRMIARGYSVALINGLECMDTKVRVSPVATKD